MASKNTPSLTPQAQSSVPDMEIRTVSSLTGCDNVQSDCNMEEVEEEMIETQPTDLNSQEQHQKQQYEETLWGYLYPGTSAVSRIDFVKSKSVYRIGRAAKDQSGNEIDFRFNGFPKISAYHRF